MVEYKRKRPIHFYKNQYPAKTNEWVKLHDWGLAPPSKVQDFDKYDYKINGIVYTDYSEEFHEAWAKEQFWAKLND